MIPLLGFAQLTFVGAVIGGVLLAVLNRRSDRPRHRFLQVTAALTALSCVPSVAMPPDAGTKAALVAIHLLAAAIIVPVLARHARD
jgi:peptidoglycan/LPS O-acetylase OafA/YrhL